MSGYFLNKKKEEDYYQPKRVRNFQNNDYIKCENNGDKNRNFSLDENDST